MIKNLKLEDIRPVKAIEQHIWRMFDILRSNSMGLDDYHIVLLFLSLYKDDQISKDFLLGEIQHKLGVPQIESAPNSNNPKIEYSIIIESFTSSLIKFNDRGFRELIDELFQIEKTTLVKYFSEIFDFILYHISQSQGRFGGEFIQPLELTRFICSLADLPENSSVFNPFAGIASFSVYLDQSQNYFGQEINQKTWALGALRIIAHERPGNSKYVCDDSISNWPDESKKFDLIVSTPPYGFRTGNQYSVIGPETRTVEQFLVEKGIHSLSDEGKLIALLPHGFLFRGMNEQQMRQFLIDEDLLDTIISLPGGLLSNTGIPLIILIINKKKERPGKVRFIKADKFVESISSREKFLNDYALNSLIHGRRDDEDALRIVDNAQIRNCDYNLNVPRYFQKEIEVSNNERLVKLKEILYYVRGQRDNLPKNGKFVRIRDLKEERTDFKLTLSDIRDIELRSLNVHQINESCILLAIRWRTLKPTYFHYEGEPIYRRMDILSFRVDETVADYRYIINELYADYVQEQLESYRLGATIPFIRRSDLLEIAIKLPSLAEQRAKVQGIVELSDKIKILKEERNALAHNVSTKLYESVSTIKHSLGKPLLNIGSSLRNIEKALSRLNAEWLQVKLNERYDLTIKDSFDSIYSDLELVHSMLRNNESVLDISNYQLTEIDFLAFIKGYVDKIKSAESSNVSTKLDIHPDIKIQLKNKILLQANTELLEIALNAIVENANMHAFTNNSKKYKLEFRVSLYVAPSMKKQNNVTIGRFDTYIKVEVANNGKPFPENYSLDKLIRKNSFAGETGNTGQGGFDLNEIIKYHNNGISTLELITKTSTSEFTTTYLFLIPFNR